MQHAPRPRDAQKYSVVAQVSHWLTAVLVLLAFFYSPGGNEERVYASALDFERQLHETLGLCVLTLSAARLAWSLFDPTARS